MSIDWIRWGDAPTWLGSLTTLAAFAAAWRLVKIELGRDRVNQQALKEQREADERDEQANAVAAWWSTAGSRPRDIKQPPRIIGNAVVRNHSRLPIYDVKLDIVLQGGRVVHSVELPLVEPDSERRVGLPSDLRTVASVPRFIPVSIEFRDAAGRVWRRNEQGSLAFLRRVMLVRGGAKGLGNLGGLGRVVIGGVTAQSDHDAREESPRSESDKA